MERKQTRIQLIATVVFSLLMAVVPSGVQGAVEVLEFNSTQQEQRYLDLIDELRCMVCQNQNLADSNAGLAKDLRERTYQMVRTGQSDDEIVDYMIERYGDFVMYRPPLKGSTYLLWFGPVIFIVIAGLTALAYSRRMRTKPTQTLSAQERQKVRQLLDK